MKIDASKRVRPRGEKRPLHRRLSLRRVWQQRLFYGSVLALIGVLVGWLAGLEWQTQLIVAGLGLSLGALWRFRQTARGSERWAFSWIEARAGLSYQTAYELQGGDAHGLGEAVRTRAASANALELPPLQPWYLPLLLVILLVIALPNFVLPGLQTPLGSLRTPLAERPTPVADATPEPSLQGASSRANAPQTGAASASRRPAAQNPAQSRSFDTDQDAKEGAAQAQGEEAALEKFLQQNPPPTTNSQASGNAGQAGTPGRNQQQAGEQSGGEQRQEAGGTQGQQRQAQQPPPEDEQQSGQGNAQQGNKPGQAKSQSNRVQKAAGSSAQPQQVPPDEKIRNTGRTAKDSARKNEQTSTEGVDMLQLRNSASREKDELNQMVRDGEASQRAGTGPGAAIDSSRQRLGGNTRAAERLTGERRAGLSTMARSEGLEQGRVPSSLPQLGTPQSYQRATEEVIREGRIPAEYQNIVRDYFR